MNAPVNARLVSTAVMSRRFEPADSLDYFPTAPWATRGFCTHVLPRFEAIDPVSGLFGVDAIDPACGEGHMAAVLREFMPLVTASDIFPYGFGNVADFMHPDEVYAPRGWFITNPPFNLGMDFVLRALSIAKRGVAVLVRTAFLEGEERQDRLFGPNPPTLVAQYVERVPMHKGRWVVNGTTATAYCWLVWLADGGRDTRFTWIPKSRKALTRPDDWMRFGGCFDIPAKHQAAQLAEQWKRQPALSLAAVRANMALERPKPATIGDVARKQGALL